ncbi:vascular-related unknown protein 4-like [Silene latifolia]|uniref:vascular-related unknown protein 4-like n=1 Tax=Silene latifolia TaxID=37657 RepID=UPI003D77775E
MAAYSMNSTNNMTKFVSSTSDSSNCSDEFSSWDLYEQDFIANNFSGSDYSSLVSGTEPWSAARNPHRTFVDQDLEDTASSPAHSPKVNDLSTLYMMSQNMDAIDFSHQENGWKLQKTQVMESTLETELRKKGLCLVPVSKVVNVLGFNI